jgi:hypothetical protein
VLRRVREQRVQPLLAAPLARRRIRVRHREDIPRRGCAEPRLHQVCQASHCGSLSAVTMEVHASMRLP